MAHKNDVKYEHTVEEIDLPATWKARRLGNGQWTVSGPCLVCEGSAYGPDLSEDGPAPKKTPGEDSAAMAGPDADGAKATVHAKCRCGNDHSVEDKESCGREWWVTL